MERWLGRYLESGELRAWLWRAFSASANGVIKVVTAWLDVPCDELPTHQKCDRARIFSHVPVPDERYPSPVLQTLLV
jgi:hypothetical protein